MQKRLQLSNSEILIFYSNYNIVLLFQITLIIIWRNQKLKNKYFDKKIKKNRYNQNTDKNTIEQIFLSNCKNLQVLISTALNLNPNIYNINFDKIESERDRAAASR